jgi:hypothetical protein
MSASEVCRHHCVHSILVRLCSMSCRRPGRQKPALDLATRFLLCNLSVQRDIMMNPCSHCFFAVPLPPRRTDTCLSNSSNKWKIKRIMISAIEHICSCPQLRHYAWIGDSLAVPQIMQGVIACCHRYVRHACAIRSSCCDQKHVNKMIIGQVLIASSWCGAARASLTIWLGGWRGCSKSEILVLRLDQ